VLAGAPGRVAARSAGTPLYVALGDSIDFGFGDDIFLDGFGYVPPVGAALAVALGQPVDVQNLAEFGATTRDILLTQVPVALGAIAQHQGDPVIVTWGGGGGDVGQVALSRQAATCRQQPSCLGRFNAVLNEAEQAIDRTIGQLRAAAGPNARIFMRTQYNALLKTGCSTPDRVALGNATLEGAPGTVLDRGLNDRIRTVAARYDATVVDLFIPFAVGANVLIGPDCTHPNGLGYQVIAGLFAAQF
jgi:lysophospholipase L1-like esterase